MWAESDAGEIADLVMAFARSDGESNSVAVPAAANALGGHAPGGAAAGQWCRPDRRTAAMVMVSATPNMVRMLMPHVEARAASMSRESRDSMTAPSTCL